MPRAIAFLSKCLKEQTTVIGASSLANDSSRAHYKKWVELPYITHESFATSLKNVLTNSDISGIYTPHPVVWNYLNQHLGEIAPGILLLNTSPYDTELESHRASVLRARELLGRSLAIASAVPPKPELAAMHVAALCRHSEDIPGMCDHEKVRALYEICRHCPPGDIVEIGTWWGKSAFVLLWLAQNFDIGKVLCVDPWSDAHLIQNDENALVDTLSSQLSAEEAFEVFQVNLLPYANGDLNYLRMPSTEAANRFRTSPLVTTPAFGFTQYSGRTSILHIDGNHAYESVNADLQSWLGGVISGGWVIIDDYIWPFGDGPRRVGDAFIETHKHKIHTSFVMGSALFFQLI